MVTKAKPKKVYKSADTGKIVSKATADANPKETYAIDAPEVETPSNVPLGTFAKFVNGDDEFIGVVQSLDPLTVVEHLVRNGCQCEDVKEMDSLDGWTVTPMTAKDVFEALN